MSEKGLTWLNLIGGFLTLTLALTVPCVASASPPSNMAVGEIDAIVSFCSRLDPGLESDARQLRGVLLRETDPGAKNSAEYRQGHDLVSDALAGIEHKQALAACGTLAPKGHKSGDR